MLSFLRMVPSSEPRGPVLSSLRGGVAHKDNSPPFRIPLSARGKKDLPHFAGLRDGDLLVKEVNRLRFWVIALTVIVVSWLAADWFYHVTAPDLTAIPEFTKSP
jgi:hypothetical protein